MRKVMLLAAMLAMVLVAAAPAFAQVTGGDVNVQYVDCSQVAAAVADQYGAAGAVGGVAGAGSGDATLGGASGADASADAAAEVANELGISVEQVNACLGGVAAGEDVDIDGDGDVDADDAAAAAEASASASASASAGAAAGGEAAAASAGTLPDTGGASLITLGAGALLVAGGLVARRIVR